MKPALGPPAEGAAINHIISVEANRRTTLRLIGDIDVTNAQEIEAVIRQVTRAGPVVLVIDLQRVTFLDSAGVRLILQAYRWQQEVGNSLRVVPGEGIARRVLELMGLKLVPGIDTDEGAQP